MSPCVFCQQKWTRANQLKRHKELFVDFSIGWSEAIKNIWAFEFDSSIIELCFCVDTATSKPIYRCPISKTPYKYVCAYHRYHHRALLSLEFYHSIRAHIGHKIYKIILLRFHLRSLHVHNGMTNGATVFLRKLCICRKENRSMNTVRWNWPVSSNVYAIHTHKLRPLLVLRQTCRFCLTANIAIEIGFTPKFMTMCACVVVFFLGLFLLFVVVGRVWATVFY